MRHPPTEPPEEAAHDITEGLARLLANANAADPEAEAYWEEGKEMLARGLALMIRLVRPPHTGP